MYYIVGEMVRLLDTCVIYSECLIDRCSETSSYFIFKKTVRRVAHEIKLLQVLMTRIARII